MAAKVKYLGIRKTEEHGEQGVYVRNGNIELQSDCHHELRGTVVQLPDWED